MEVWEEITDFRFKSMILDVWDSMDPSMAVLLLLACGLITVGIKSVSILGLVRISLKGRPVDIMLLQDLILQMVIGITYHVGNIIKVIARKSIDEVLQTDLACHVMYTFNILLLLNIVLGSFGMAVFRVIVLFRSHIVKDWIGAIKYTIIIRAFEWSFVLFALMASKSFADGKKSASALEFCRNRNPEMAEIISEYNGIIDEDHKQNVIGQSVIVLLCLFVSLLEVGCYVAIFYRRYQSDKTMKGILSLSAINGRVRSSSMTFGGQVLTFVCKIIMQFCVIVYINKFRSLDISSSMAYIFSVQQAILSIVQIIAAPDLRRSIFHLSY